jgi:hypothetical protein
MLAVFFTVMWLQQVSAKAAAIIASNKVRFNPAFIPVCLQLTHEDFPMCMQETKRQEHLAKQLVLWDGSVDRELSMWISSIRSVPGDVAKVGWQGCTANEHQGIFHRCLDHDLLHCPSQEASSVFSAYPAAVVSVLLAWVVHAKKANLFPAFFACCLLAGHLSACAVTLTP